MDHSYDTIEAQIRHAKQLRSIALGMILGELLGAAWLRLAQLSGYLTHRVVNAPNATPSAMTGLHAN